MRMRSGIWFAAGAAVLAGAALLAEAPRSLRGQRAPNAELRRQTFATEATAPTSGPVSQRSSRSMYEYWKEAYDRLEDHPDAGINAEGFKIDPALNGEWIGVNAITNGRIYGVYFNGYTFRGDGSGGFERVVHTLRNNSQLVHNASMDLNYPFIWGIEAGMTDDQQPVTLVRVVFQDGTWMRLYYAVFENGSVGMVLFDEQRQRPSNERNVFYEGRSLIADWEAHKEEIRVAIVRQYNARQRLNQQTLISQMMAQEQMNHYLFMNTMNMGWCGSIVC